MRLRSPHDNETVVPQDQLDRVAEMGPDRITAIRLSRQPLCKPVAKEGGRPERSASQTVPRVPTDTQQSQAVRKHFGHLCDAVNAFLIVHRNFDNLEI